MNNKTLYFQTKKFEQKNIKELDNWDIEITWYASTKKLDSYNDVVEPTAFEKYFDTFKRNPILLLGHNQDKAIWTVIEAKVDSKGLKIKAIIKNDEDWIKWKVLNWTVKWFSIWYLPRKVKYEETEVDGKLQIIRRLIEVELKEISIVSVPANPYSLFQSAKEYFAELKNMTFSKLEVKWEDWTETEVSFDNISDDDLIEALQYIKNKENKEKIKENDEVETLDEIDEAINEDIEENDKEIEDENIENEITNKDNKNDWIVITKDVLKALIKEIKEAKTEIKILKSNVNSIWIKKWLSFKTTKQVEIKKNNTIKWSDFISQTLV